ncbi:MAG TPA: response regulator [Thermoanaerobaculia bacterium]|nr:response regulator [Thermoanaerobaculia bacterium]
MANAPVPELDNAVAEAARIANVPVAFVGFVDNTGEVIKAVRGWNVSQIPPAMSFAIRVANAGPNDVVVVPDTTRDVRFSSHPLVTGSPNIRFYAGAPLFDDGRFIGALSVVDRTPRTLTDEQVTVLRLLAKQITRELDVRREKEELNERFREFFEQTDDFVMSISHDFRLVHSNETVSNALGYTREELTSRTLLQFVDPEARQEFTDSLRGVFGSGEPRIVETTFRTSGGRRMIMEGSLRPRVIDGRTLMIRVVFRDITERKQFESELGNARDAALEAARLKSQFLTNVSHEIRTPMNGIIGMLDLLESTPMTEEQRDFARQAHASADQLLSIVNNILYVSAVEAGGLGSTSVDFDLYKTLQRIVEVMKVAALGKDIEVEFAYDKNLPPLMRGDQGKLRQVVTNLMENAIKFTDEGKVMLRVAQQTETDTHRVVRIEIHDTGIGISEEDRLLLFEKFSQVDGSQSRKYQGTGLGLATARQLVETMGGLIDVESKPGVGSTFWFTVSFPKHAAGRAPIASSALDFKGGRVLLVDQFPTSRKIVRHYLDATWGMRVETADNAVAALAALRDATERDPFRVVVFDAMPDIDAFSFAREVRADGRIAATSLLYLVASNNDVNRETMREAGITAYVVKPVGQTELFDAMTVALAHDALAAAKRVGQPASPETMAPPQVSVDARKNVRVLLAEDNFLNAKLTMSQLEKLGYHADSVPNGKEAVAAVEKNDYQIILMDCQMPVLDGYQATIEIRRRDRERGAKRRIIAMTANALEGDREKCLAAGMDDYLSKPTKHDELETALARYFATV